MPTVYSASSRRYLTDFEQIDPHDQLVDVDDRPVNREAEPSEACLQRVGGEHCDRCRHGLDRPEADRERGKEDRAELRPDRHARDGHEHG